MLEVNLMEKVRSFLFRDYFIFISVPPLFFHMFHLTYTYEKNFFTFFLPCDIIKV